MSSGVAKNVSSTGGKLQPSILQDSVGPHIIVTCAALSGKLYLLMLDESKKPLSKCIHANGKCYSPYEFESLAGKKAKKWKQSLLHLDKPLSSYDLSCSSVSQLSMSTNNTNTAVCDNTGRTQSDCSQGSVCDPVSVPPGPPATPSTQPVQLSSSTDGTPVTTGPTPPLVDTVLSFIAAFRLKGDIDSLKRIVVERFCNEDVEVAKRLLWDSSSSHLIDKGLVFHSRRDSDRRSQLIANLNDILHVFDTLDLSDAIPSICCDAYSLHRIPPLSLDPVAEQVHTNSQALKALSSTIEGLEKKLSSFLVSFTACPPADTGSHQNGVSYANVASSTLPPMVSKSSVAPHKGLVADDRSCNVILFGLPEGKSLVESKKLVDEVLEYLSGKHIQIKDMFRLGKYNPPSSSSSRPRPILIKLLTAWDRKLVLLRKSSLKDFRLKKLFLREDVSPEHRLRTRKSTESGGSTQGPPVTVASISSPSSDGLSSNVVLVPPATHDISSQSVLQTPPSRVSRSRSHSPLPLSVVQGSLNNRHGSA